MLTVTQEGITVSVATTGHNARTLDLYSALEPDAIAAFLADRFAPREARSKELLAAHKRFLAATATGIADDGVASKATDFAKQVRVEIKEVDLTRVAIKVPVLAAQKQIDGAARDLTDPLLAASVEIERRVTAWLRAKDIEQRRLAAEAAARAEEEAQRLAAEAASTGSQEAEDAAVEALAEFQQAEAIVEAPTPDLTRVRTQLGTTSSLRDNWVYSVEDVTKVPAAYLMVNDAVVKAAIKSGTRLIPGLLIVNEPKVAVR